MAAPDFIFAPQGWVRDKAGTGLIHVSDLFASIAGGGTVAPPLTLTTSIKTASGTVLAGAYQLLFDNIGPSDCTVAGKTLKPGAGLTFESAARYGAVAYTITAGGSLEITEGR